MSLRSMARRFATRQIHSQAADMVGRFNLLRTSRRPADVSKLRHTSTINLAEIWSNPQVHDAWEADQAAVLSHWPTSSGKGSVNKGDCRAIYYLISALKPTKIVEVGTNVGRSTAYMATAIRSSSPSSILTTVDILDVNALDGPWSMGGEMTKSPRDTLASFGLSDHVIFNQSCADEYFASNPEADLIFLDGSHAHDDVYREVTAALGSLRTNGLILLHDYYPDGRALFSGSPPLMGPYRALQRLRDEGAPICVLPFGDLPWPTRGNEHASSLALVVRS